MNIKRFLQVFFIIVLVSSILSCNRTKDQRKNIERLENEIYTEKFVLNAEGLQKAQSLLDAYLEYVEANKNNEDVSGYLFRAADLAMNINKPEQALELYNKLLYLYPDYEKAPESLFMMGFIYENYLQNFGKAKEIYEDFLKRYPTHDFADDAALSIKNLGIPPEELIRQFQQQNAATDSVAVL